MPYKPQIKKLDYYETGGGGGGLDSIVAGDNIDVDATDPANPIVSVPASLDITDTNGINFGATAKFKYKPTGLSGFYFEESGTGAVQFEFPGDVYFSSRTNTDGSGDYYPTLFMGSTGSTIEDPVTNGVAFTVDYDGGLNIRSDYATNGQSNYGTLKTDTLTAGRTYQLPDAGGTLALTDDILWGLNTYGIYNYAQPKTTAGLVMGSDLHSSVYNSFQGAIGIYNDNVGGAGGGLNYYGVLSYGTGFTAFGSLTFAGAAGGTNASPTATLTDKYLGGYTFVGYDGTDWGISDANHTFPGLWGRAATDASGGSMSVNTWIGGILTPMIGLETDTNAIKFNEAMLDSDITFYSDTGTTLTLDGGTSLATFGGDINFAIGAARTLKVADRTDGAGSGYALTIAAGAQKSGTGSGGALNLNGGTGSGVTVGGGVNITGGGSLTGGAVTIDGGTGVAPGNVLLATVRGQARFGNGTAAAPTIALNSSTGTGFYRVGADNLGLSVGGTLRMDWTTSTLTLADTYNIAFNTTTGTKIGTGTTQKIGFYNATPVVQQTGDVKTALQTLGLVASATYPTASDTVVGDVELATAAETSTGTDATRAVTPDGLAGSTIFGRKTVSIQVTDGTTNVSTGDGKAYFTIPESLNGMNLVRAQATVVTAGTTNATTVMIHNKTDAQDMLSGAISIASAGTVGTVGTIDTANDDVATNDVIRIDVDSVSTTAPKGLMVVLEFQLP